ncbi:MAG: sigma-70 family RNA polymerase sigma factor [Bacteroidaceae bacterium]|nr:sigma-70 family RNA polymerase sigma factor [Bacteroidaceae bacterium]
MSIHLFKSYRQMTDEELMKRASHGNDAAFEELYRRYARRLQGFFFRQLGGDDEAAADLTHDVFLRAYEAKDRYAEGSNVATWFFSIAYNLCKNTYRHNDHITRFLATLDAEPQTEEEVEVRLTHEQQRDAVRKALQSLPPPLHLLFSLHYEEELTFSQIAQIEHLPEGTVKSRIYKTLNIIRQKLADL